MFGDVNVKVEDGNLGRSSSTGTGTSIKIGISNVESKSPILISGTMNAKKIKEKVGNTPLADACIDAGRDELVGKIVAMDYSTQVEEAIKEGKLYGTVNQDPVTYGKLTVEYIAKYMTGEMKAEDFEKEIYIDLPTVDASNVNDTAATWS